MSVLMYGQMYGRSRDYQIIIFTQTILPQNFAQPLILGFFHTIRHVTLRLKNRRNAAPLRQRNRAATTVLVREQKPYPV